MIFNPKHYSVGNYILYLILSRNTRYFKTYPKTLHQIKFKHDSHRFFILFSKYLNLTAQHHHFLPLTITKKIKIKKKRLKNYTVIIIDHPKKN